MEKIIIDRMEAEDFLAMILDITKQKNINQYYSTAQILENIANEFRDMCKL